MSVDSEYLDWMLPRPPLWFASAELLTELWHVEIYALIQCFARHPDIRKLFDAPEITIPQRAACFELLAHHKIVEIIEEIFLGRYENPPTLSDEESNALRSSLNLVSPDAPPWVLEMDGVAELLPVRLYSALPEPLRDQSFVRSDEAVRSAAKTLSTVEQIQALTARVSDEQLQRLKERWSAATGQAEGPKMPKHWKKGFEGLGAKVTNLSKHMHVLTDKQQMALSLKVEYGLGPTEIASRMGIDRKTLSEHLAAADKRLTEAYSNDKRKRARAKNDPD
jgi:DNA-directed RNA polymerase specialized sigma24 family protein